MTAPSDSLVNAEPSDAKQPIRKGLVLFGLVGLLGLIALASTLPAIFTQDEQPVEQAAKPLNTEANADELQRRLNALSKAEQDRIAANPQPTLTASVSTPTGDITPVKPAESSDRVIRTPLPPGLGAQGSERQASPRAVPEPNPEIDSAGRSSAPIAFDAPNPELVRQGREAANRTVEARVQELIGKDSPRQQQTLRELTRPEPAVQSAPHAPDSGLASLLGLGGSQGRPVLQSNKAWLDERASQSGSKTAIKAYRVSNPYTLLQGKVIEAVLTRSISTEVPGEVTACSTVAVYDSISSEHLLIPRGSCFYGAYNADVRDGQSRLMFAFNRLTLPDGTSVDLQASQGADSQGTAGIAGDVNNHYLKRFTSGFFLAFLANRVERNEPSPNTGGATGAKTAAGQILVEVSRDSLDRTRTLQPTISVSKGTRLNVLVNRDIEFDAPYGRGN
jgi:type IV secretion system protein TrbI